MINIRHWNPQEFYDSTCKRLNYADLTRSMHIVCLNKTFSTPNDSCRPSRFMSKSINRYVFWIKFTWLLLSVCYSKTISSSWSFQSINLAKPPFAALVMWHLDSIPSFLFTFKSTNKLLFTDVNLTEVTSRRSWYGSSYFCSSNDTSVKGKEFPWNSNTFHCR